MGESHSFRCGSVKKGYKKGLEEGLLLGQESATPAKRGEKEKTETPLKRMISSY
jgi:hypothetical protein